MILPILLLGAIVAMYYLLFRHIRNLSSEGKLRGLRVKVDKNIDSRRSLGL